MYFQNYCMNVFIMANKNISIKSKDFISAALIVSSVCEQVGSRLMHFHIEAKHKRSHELLRTGWAEASFGGRWWSSGVAFMGWGTSVAWGPMSPNGISFLSRMKASGFLSVVIWDLCDDYGVQKASQSSHQNKWSLSPLDCDDIYVTLVLGSSLFEPCGLEKNHEFSLIQVLEPIDEFFCVAYWTASNIVMYSFLLFPFWLWLFYRFSSFYRLF